MNAIVQFIAEFVARLFSKKPWFFKVLQIIAAIVAAVSGGINALDQTTLPGWVKALGSTAVWVGALVAVIIAQLPRPNPPTP